MAVVPITINGVAYPKTKEAGAKPFPVTIVGYAWITGLHVGGGPAEPPQVVIPGDPPVIWGPGDPRPQPPIHLPPEDKPPPDHPLEEMLTFVAKPPPPEGGWSFMPEYGWVYDPGEETAQPKGPRR